MATGWQLLFSEFLSVVFRFHFFFFSCPSTDGTKAKDGGPEKKITARSIFSSAALRVPSSGSLIDEICRWFLVFLFFLVWFLFSIVRVRPKLATRDHFPFVFLRVFFFKSVLFFPSFHVFYCYFLLGCCCCSCCCSDANRRPFQFITPVPLSCVCVCVCVFKREIRSQYLSPTDKSRAVCRAINQSMGASISLLRWPVLLRKGMNGPPDFGIRVSIALRFSDRRSANGSRWKIQRTSQNLRKKTRFRRNERPQWNWAIFVSFFHNHGWTRMQFKQKFNQVLPFWYQKRCNCYLLERERERESERERETKNG